MAGIKREKIIPYMDSYKIYLEKQERGVDSRPLSNTQEDYKRGIALRAHETLNPESWEESEIGSGSIGARVIKAVQKHINLIGRFQVTAFSDKVQESGSAAEQLLFDLYHERKEQGCFERLCELFGKKYDLIAYLYFVLDPNRYLPIRPTIFDEIFKKLGISLQTSGRCSWDNYQEFLNTVAEVRGLMMEYYQQEDIDMLDAHSFLWTFNQNVLDSSKGETMKEDVTPVKEKKVEVGAIVTHKDYADGAIIKITDKNIYVDFAGKQRIFPYPEAFEKEYLILE